MSTTHQPLDNVVSMFKTPTMADEFLHLYDQLISSWPHNVIPRDIQTSFGTTHVNSVGPDGATPLVLIPGFGTNSTMWFANITTLSQHYRIFAVDTIGQPGRSVTRNALSPATTAIWLAEVLDGLTIKQAYVAGFSLGGWIALDFAIKHPERTKKLALVDPPASLQPLPFSFFLHSLFPMIIHPTRRSLQRYFRWLTRGNRGMNTGWGQTMVLGILNWKPQPPIRVKPFTDEQLRACQAPTLLLVAERSVLYEPSTAIKRATQLIPNLTAEIVPDASHGLVYEHADLINNRIVSFFQEQD
jgi:pimeloyl-ACP methyl ester carboxylesterase